MSSLKNKNALAGAALSTLILSNDGSVHSGRLLIFQAAPQAAGACVSIVDRSCVSHDLCKCQVLVGRSAAGAMLFSLGGVITEN